MTQVRNVMTETTSTMMAVLVARKIVEMESSKAMKFVMTVLPTATLSLTDAEPAVLFTDAGTV